MIREMSGHEINALHYELLIKDILSAAEKLPPFPDVVWKVMGLIRRIAPIKQIEDVIQYDPILSARVLRLSQSVHYGRRHKVSSLKDAILVLGNQNLVLVVMTACASQYFQTRVSGYDKNEIQLWRHSVATAFIGQALAKHFKSKKSMTVYTACLLHDIGKMVLDVYARMYLQVDVNQIHKAGVRFVEAERRAFGIDHQELGRIIAHRWQFPKEVVTGIRFHHTPDRAESDREIPSYIYMADHIANAPMDDEASLHDLERNPVFKAMGITGEHVREFQKLLARSMLDVELYLKNEA